MEGSVCTFTQCNKLAKKLLTCLKCAGRCDVWNPAGGCSFHFLATGDAQVATVDPDGWKYVFVDHQDFLKELETATGGEL